MYFFLAWFPLYLVKGRGMSILQVGFLATLPAICGFSGGISGGMLSDRLLKRGHSLTFARKTPIVIGMLLATSLIACNYLGLAWAMKDQNPIKAVAVGGREPFIQGKEKWRYQGPKPDMYQTEHNELFAGIRRAKPLKSEEKLVPDESDWKMKLDIAPMAMPGTTKLA